MAMVWRWRRAWRSRVSSTMRSGSGGGGFLQLISGSTTTASGTTLSTATCTTSSDPLGERSLPTLEVKEEGLKEEEEEEVVKTREHMRGLVEEFCAGANGNVTAPDRWLSELHVAWLLRLAELDASVGRIFVSRQLQHLAQSWILAMWMINTSIWGFYSQEETPHVASQLVKFVQATLLKMLTFVQYAIVAPLNLDDPTAPSSSEGAAEKLRALLDVRDALALASEQSMVSFRSSPYLQSTIITDDMGGLLSAELGKLDQAVRDTADQIRVVVMSSLADYDDSSCCSCAATNKTRQTSSSDIHKVTRSVIRCISVLSTYASIDPIISTLITKMVCSLEEKLARVSRSFIDRSLGFLFLINNSNFIWQKLHTSWLLHDGTHKIDSYIQSYLQVSWAPVLKCLHNNPALCCFMTNSPLPKFESKFLATYDAQKLWKVPDPDLRKRLRKAVIHKVASSFKTYLEDNNSITPRVTPEEMEEMLQELFEG